VLSPLDDRAPFSRSWKWLEKGLQSPYVARYI